MRYAMFLYVALNTEAALMVGSMQPTGQHEWCSAGVALAQ